MNRSIALLGAMFLMGCGAGGAGNGLSFREAPSSTGPIALTKADLAGGCIVVSGPEGYCVDASTLRSTASGGFAAIASCRILTQGKAGPIVEPALLTVTVDRTSASVPTPQDLADALETTLTREADLDSVTAGQMATGGATAFDGSDDRHWRGAFALGNHMVALALYAPEGSPLIGAQGAAFLNTVSSRIRANSDNGGTPSLGQTETSQDPITLRLSRLFGGRDLQ